jgi:hypothetical protein
LMVLRRPPKGSKTPRVLFHTISSPSSTTREADTCGVCGLCGLSDSGGTGGQLDSVRPGHAASLMRMCYPHERTCAGCTDCLKVSCGQACMHCHLTYSRHHNHGGATVRTVPCVRTSTTHTTTQPPHPHNSITPSPTPPPPQPPPQLPHPPTCLCSTASNTL